MCRIQQKFPVFRCVQHQVIALNCAEVVINIIRMQPSFDLTRDYQ
jgi:hypothetical protein